ncbi:apolipoprotein N-acyltransferase [Roseospira marina]|uniref:Apolipoprotein N-acyltransferase n=1 Tax=Roseospira marina TaxID=140057 RepID=A0A5M6IB58_9PROT|nr:apolipoprotein N-acyltransferase [Roseospira marina]KAA5604959.1 apolipoprotein N-acyltransferase [Roseospira marina]MBB4315042.1 apolipoprotein N-acyltransferase [Roseospira marina]MBB5088042.1 apolipoprotein N-acyltransferase [Roseospira marina]
MTAPTRRARLAGWVAGLRGWRRRGLTCGLGALAALALPPFHILPALAVALIGLVWLLDGVERPLRGGFGTGWWFGFGFFVVGIHWIAYALLVDAAAFGWMIPFAVGGLSAVLALFMGAGTALAGYLWRPGHAARIGVLAATWVLAEWLRMWVATGFPWNMLGTVWMPLPPAVQSASLIGALGLSGLTVMALAAPAVLGDARSAARSLTALVVAVAPLAGLSAWGAVRLATVDPGTVEGVRLRLVQPNLSQTEKWDPARRELNLIDQVALSRQPGFDAVTHVIWSETASAFPLNADVVHRFMAADAAPTDGLLITGAPRVTTPGQVPFQVWNSLMAIAPDGSIRDTYDKAHLVPFGEYVPFADVLPVQKITPGRVDFTPGPGPRTLRLKGLPPVAPLICYEVIFPGAVVRPDDRPAWMLNLTNDGWYGLSPGPHQHFATARLRAVEEGLPLVRVANTGISGVVDPLGRVTARLALGTRGTIDAALPGALRSTVFARLGNALPIAAALFFIVAVALYNHKELRL